MSGLFGPYPNNAATGGGSAKPPTTTPPSTTTTNSGDDGLVFHQNVPAAVWNITHSFPRSPNVAVYDSTGQQVFPDVIVVNSTTIRVTFSGASGGTAILT